MKRALQAPRGRKMAVAVMAMAVLGCASATAIFAAANATVIQAGNLSIRAEGSISPNALPRNRMVPITLRARGSVATIDGSHVPAARTVELQIDRHFRIESTGLPSCSARRIKAMTPSRAMKACGSALIGRGHATAEVAFPESAPFTARGPLLGFNGPSIHGYPEMLFYIYVAVPAPVAMVVVAKLSKDSGRYAYKISQTIPRLAGGSGSLTGFEITIGRRWVYRGQQHSYLSAECPDGRFFDQVEAGFADGASLVGTLVNTCQGKA